MEFELKFGLQRAARASLAAALRAHGARTLRLQARYYDTADGVLAAHRIALRLRREGGRWVQTLKAAGDSFAHRQEHEVVVPRPELDVSRHDGSAAGDALQAALAGASEQAWIEQHRSDIRRLVCPLQLDDGSTVEVALDSGSITAANGASTTLDELEIEHREGALDGLFALAADWVGHGGLWLSSASKSARGERLLAGGEPRALKASRPQLNGAASGAALLRAVLRAALAQVVANAADVAEGAAGADHVHQLRVGLRRLRTALRELAALSPAIDARWAPVLARSFAQLGRQRDQQAVAEAVRPLLEAADAPRLGWQPLPTAEPADVVAQPEFQRTLVEISALAHAADDRFAQMSGHDVRALVAARLDKLFRAVVRDGRGFRKLPRERQHRVRKRLKRLRYLSEFALALWPDAPHKRWFSRLGRAQDALGAHNDVAVAAAAFRHDASTNPGAWFAAGYLQAHLAETARASRKSLRRLGAVKRDWRD